MTKIVLCYGVILGLYCLVHGVYSSEDDITSKHSDAKHNRRRGVGNSESVIPKDKMFIKSESPLRGRRIHQTAWSEEEVTENSPEEFKIAEEGSDSRDSWNFEKLYSYLLSLVYKTEEMEQVKITPSETVAMIRDKIKSEIKARNKPGSGKKDSEVSKSPESKRLTYETNFETRHLNRRVENSESSEDDSEDYNAYESCEEDEDSSLEKHDNRRNKGNIKHKDKKENGSKVEDCYEDEESVGKETGSTNAKTDIKKEEATSSKKETVKERKESTSKNKNPQLPGSEITIMNGTDMKEKQQPQQKNTSTTRIASKPKSTDATPQSKHTAETNEDGNVESSTDLGITSTSSNVHESTVVNALPTNSGLEKSTDQFIQTKPDIQEKVNFNMATESNAHVTPTKSESTLNVNSIQKETSNTGTASTQKGLVTDSKSATEALPWDNFEMILTAPEFIPINNKEAGNTEMSSNKITEVKPNMDEMLNVPVETAQVYGRQSEAQKVDLSETEVSSQRKLQNQVAKGTQSETLLDTAVKTSMSDSGVFLQENYENMENLFQQESLFNYGRKDDILEEYNLKNEFIELSDNNKNEFMDMLKDYNTNNQNFGDLSQHSSISQNVEFNEENTNQETFDTILEFLYKHSKNPLILSLRNSSKTLI